MTTLHVTFGQRYARETHPVDERAHPDGWFEYEGDMSVFELERAIWRHLTPPGRRIAEFACTYVMAPRTDGTGSGIDAKLTVVGMTATNFTIADPSDAGMLDVAGFDSAVPNLIADFARGI